MMRKKKIDLKKSRKAATDISNGPGCFGRARTENKTACGNSERSVESWVSK
jgi:hypothetical protein